MGYNDLFVLQLKTGSEKPCYYPALMTAVLLHELGVCQPEWAWHLLPSVPPPPAATLCPSLLSQCLLPRDSALLLSARPPRPYILYFPFSSASFQFYFFILFLFSRAATLHSKSQQA